MLAAAGMSACSKEETATTPAEAKYIQVTIPEDAVAGETRTAVDGTETTWVQGDKVAVFLYNGSTTQKFEFTADKTGATTTFTGDVPVGSYSLAAAHYPYSCGATFDAVNKVFKHTWGTSYFTTNLADYDFMYTNVWETPFEINEDTKVLPVNFTFKPLMARIKMSLGLDSNETPKKIIISTSGDVMPTAGTIDRLGNFTASSATNSITIPTDRKEFTIGMLPVSIHSTMNVQVMTADGLTYSDKSFTLAGLKRNHHYTMSVPCNSKTVTIGVPDAIDKKYGTSYHENFKKFLTMVQDNDLTVDGAMTDPKGDRSKAPSQQADPDMYVHVVERRADGIVVCGAKCHQTGSINSHWHIFMPTISMGEADKDWAVSFACPTDAEGMYMIYGRQSCDTRKMEEDASIDVGNAKFGGQEALVVLDLSLIHI